MSVFTSPYNSPEAQHKRLRRIAEEYRSNAQILKSTGLWLGGIGAAFVLVGSGVWSHLGLCLLGAAFAAYHLLWVNYDAFERRLRRVAEEYRSNPQTLKSAGLWLGGIGAAFVLMGSWISSFLGLCLLGAAFGAYHLLSVHNNSPRKPPSFKCPYCSHQMALFHQWICGHCDTWNEARKRTFVERCLHCDLQPHSLSCSACGKRSIFDKYNYKLSPEEYARFPGPRPRDTGTEDTLPERRKRLRL